MSKDNDRPAALSRRKFLQNSSLAVAGAASLAQVPCVHAAFGAEDMEIKIGLIGCGGRGTGAALDALGAAAKVIYPAAGYHFAVEFEYPGGVRMFSLGPEKYEFGPCPVPEVAMPGKYRFG